MSWTAGATFQQAPVGAHIATLIRIVDIGTQTGEYKGEKTVRRQNILTWELPFELMDDGQPFIVSKFYTASLGEKANLTKDLTSWLGKAPTVPFTLDDQRALLGKSCQVILTSRENSDKITISTLAPIAKGTTVPKETHNPKLFFSLEEFDQDVFDSISSGIQGMIAKSPEYAAIVGGDEPEVDSDTDDEPPF